MRSFNLFVAVEAPFNLSSLEQKISSVINKRKTEYKVALEEMMSALAYSIIPGIYPYADG